jgi:hypothetical protein
MAIRIAPAGTSFALEFASPSSVIDFNMKTKVKEIKKEQAVLGGKFDKNN